MVDILRAVSKEMADFRTYSRDFQSQMLALQDILAKNTQKCFENQKNDLWQRSRTEGFLQLGIGVFSPFLPEQLREIASRIPNLFATGYFDPRKLDRDYEFKQNETFAGQTQRIVGALDQIKTSQDTAEQALQQSRQAAHQS